MISAEKVGARGWLKTLVFVGSVRVIQGADMDVNNMNRRTTAPNTNVGSRRRASVMLLTHCGAEFVSDRSSLCEMFQSP